MKKASIFVAALLLATAGVQAQEQETTTYGPQAGSFGVELNFNPFSGGDVFTTQGIKMRGFLNENMAIRGTLELGLDGDKNGIYNGAELHSTQKTSLFVFGLTPGFEYHFAHFKRGSVYAGAEIGFNVGSMSESTTYEDNDYGTDTNSKGSIFGFNVAAITGIDVYLTQNLYLGAELGLGYQMNKVTPNKTTTTGPDTTTDNSFQASSYFGFLCEPTFRLGWTF